MGLGGQEEDEEEHEEEEEKTLSAISKIICPDRLRDGAGIWPKAVVRGGC